LFDAQILNGLLERVDWKHAIRKPLGIIPAGTIIIAEVIFGIVVTKLSSLQPGLVFGKFHGMNALNAACKANQKFIDTHRSAIEYQETKFQDVSIL
jgi:hypothetical protein